MSRTYRKKPAKRTKRCLRATKTKETTLTMPENEFSIKSGNKDWYKFVYGGYKRRINGNCIWGKESRDYRF